MAIPEFCAWLENTAVASNIRQSTWLFPTIETIHVLFTVLVVGSITMLDLRLLNIANRDRSVSELHDEVLPWTWTSFVCAAIAGSLLFSSNATKYYHNLTFRMKMLSLLLVGINAAFFELRTYRGVTKWDQGSRIPLAAKLAGGLGLVLWIAVVAFGRWTGFTK
ncbi:MAG TPA: DUF6644 family protein [Candidatus Acidoferrales bacterium]|nr:DUF6644 family protein [Candidatus Acidoferrales bacterium]